MIYRKKRFVKRKKINSEKTDLRLRKKINTENASCRLFSSQNV